MLRTKLQREGRAFGAAVFEFFAPGIAQIAKAAGAEFILYDMEHSGAGIETIKAQISYCRGLDIAPIVRVPGTEYDFIANVLDAGAHGVMVPMVDTAEQAAFIAACTHYPPVGRRGAGFGMAHDDYLPGDPAEKIRNAHERTLTICQIETATGLANVDAIAATPGVDVLWLGHFDLTNFMGIPGQFQHPEYVAGVKRIVAAANRHGKTAAFLAMDDRWSDEYWGYGFRMFAYGLDSALFQRGLAGGLAHLKSLPGKRT
jgi:2-dehydro-3-deoxyglucarate aldolase/4-hydroxy-2-oxoheptanedioate aldolase